MPEIVKNDAGKYCLEGYGDADACYDSREEANAARDKLGGYEKKEADIPDGATVAYFQVETGTAQPTMTLTTTDSDGYKFVARPHWLPDTTAQEEARFQRIWDKVKEKLGWKSDADEATGFKVAGNHWLAVWSNDFKDRDGEIFTRKAIDDYIARVDRGIVSPPELWVWHTPGTRIGKADWVDRHEHFVMAGGTFDGTEDGRAAQAYYARHGAQKGISHGFKYPVERFDGKHYHSFNSFEFSPLPLGAEANLFTSFEGVKAAKMDEKKQAELEAVFGKDRAAQILANLEARGKALEALEVEYKDFANPAVQDANKQAVEKADKAFGELVSELLESSATPVTAALEAVKAVKAQDAKVAALENHVAALEARIKASLENPPRSSQSPETEVQTSHLSDGLQKQLKEQNTVKDGFWGTEYVKTP